MFNLTKYPNYFYKMSNHPDKDQTDKTNEIIDEENYQQNNGNASAPINQMSELQNMWKKSKEVRDNIKSYNSFILLYHYGLFTLSCKDYLQISRPYKVEECKEYPIISNY